jgi:hypothetical protein
LQGRDSPEVHSKISCKICTKTSRATKNGGIVIDSERREILPSGSAKCLKPNGNFDIPNVGKDALFESVRVDVGFVGADRVSEP